MSAIASAGALLLAAATLPQLAKLLRTRSVEDFSLPFAALNFAGLALLAWRAFEIREMAFLAVNILTTTFWGLIVMMKVRKMRGDRGSSVADAPVAATLIVSPAGGAEK